MKKRTRNIKPPYSHEEVRKLAGNLEAELSRRVGMPVKLRFSAHLDTMHCSRRLEEYLEGENKQRSGRGK